MATASICSRRASGRVPMSSRASSFLRPSQTSSTRGASFSKSTITDTSLCPRRKLFSSKPRWRSRSSVRRSSPRSTARSMSRSTALQSNRSHAAACLRLRAASSTVMAICSKSALKRLRASAQGTGTVHTLPSAERSLGRQTNSVSNWQVSRCRQRRSTWSCTGSRSRLSGHAHSVSALQATVTSTFCFPASTLTSVTSHGCSSPSTTR